MTKSDNDNKEIGLRPADRFIFDWAKNHPDEPFCREDFIDRYAAGTIRNAFSKLSKLKLIKLYCRSGYAFYVYSGTALKKNKRLMTVSHTVGKYKTRIVTFDFFEFLDSIDIEDVCKVHNVTLIFQMRGMSSNFLANHKKKVIQDTKEIHRDSIKWSKNRLLRIVQYKNGKFVFYLKCSHCPIEVTPEGLVDLASFLGGVRENLLSKLEKSLNLFDKLSIPDVGSWIVVQWHYGKDGQREISGPAFNVTFKTWVGNLARIYMKKNRKLFRMRMEVVETPRKTLPQAFTEKMDNLG
jgi:hypothetical protein